MSKHPIDLAGAELVSTAPSTRADEEGGVVGELDQRVA
jgi:hypothetical protein